MPEPNAGMAVPVGVGRTFAQEAARVTTVCHSPPETSKWNEIEQRLFSFITQN